MIKKISVFCTLGPSSLNKDFLSFSDKKQIDLLRINMSHVTLKKLPNYINYIRQFTTIPICIDTEGAQIRTSLKIKKFFKKNEYFKFLKQKDKNLFYPEHIDQALKVGDIMLIGFEGLEMKVIKNNSKEILLKTLCPGIYEINKGVHIQNRKLKLNFLTNKDYKAIEIGKKYNIKYFALSFTNYKNDIKKFNQLLPKEKKIYKIETKKALDHFDTIIKHGQEFLIDRGDLSKEISIEMIPVAQRKILKFSQKFKDKKIYVATNFLESMIENDFPNRAEVNDIFSTLSQGSAGLVLAAETAIGKNPKNCVNYLTKIIRVFKKYNNRS